MRAEKLVGRAHQEVAIEFANINWPVRRVMDGINERESPGLARQAHYFFNVVNRSHRIRSVADGNQPGVAGDLACKIIHIERAVGFIDIHKSDGCATFLQRTPGGDIGVVIEVSDDNFVSRT